MEPPFPAKCQLNTELDEQQSSPSHVPGYPRVSLVELPEMLRFLETEYWSSDLERIAGKLWWMSKQDSANISPLHRQRVKGRTIVVTEDAKLHLVWFHDRIFVKPLPRYLTSYAFWQDHLGKVSDNAQTQRCRMAALGYLRTYFFLVKSEFDFHIAQDPSLRLLPNDITWEQFCRFTTSLADIADRDVSGRYAYGEIRLTRLNFYAPLLLRKSYFQRVEYQSTSYFARFYGPILFLIGIASIILNGFQIAVGVEQANPTSQSRILFGVALWCSVFVVMCFCVLTFFLLLLYLYKVIKEWKYAIKDRLRRLEEGYNGH